MAEQQIKFYQAGSFAVGNRLLDPDERTVQASTERSNTLTSGHRACQGCGEALGARYVLDAATRAAGGGGLAPHPTGRPRGFFPPLPPAALEQPRVPPPFRHPPAGG